MFRTLRIALLVLVLATVAQSAWLANSRTTSWKETVQAVIYPVDGDGSAAASAASAYVAGLDGARFRPIEEFMAEEAARCGLPLKQPVEISLAPQVSSLPPQPPAGGNALQAILWSLHMRWWAWRNDAYKGPRPDVRLCVVYFDPRTHLPIFPAAMPSRNARRATPRTMRKSWREG